jgi:cellulose synthase/poly-beta-1,6-N-acetylglucosamine synthase-like glycosyltransferase
VCGEIAVDQKMDGFSWLNFAIAAQHFEYKISNIMDKAMESEFGFISVLPGAFSAYRFEAIDGTPLKAYFKSLTAGTKLSQDGKEVYGQKWEKGFEPLGPFEGNMYLAEDRILCFEIIAKEGQAYTLHYVKNAIARTDVPKTLVDLIKQRRRWLNGSFFATLFALKNSGRVWTDAGHSPVRKLVFTVEFAIQALQTFLSWLLPSLFFLTVYFVVTLSFPNTPLANGTIYVWLVLMILQFLLGLGNKPSAVGGCVWLRTAQSRNSCTKRTQGTDCTTLHSVRTTPLIVPSNALLRLRSFPCLAASRFYNMSMHIFGTVQMAVFCLTMYQFYYIVTGEKASGNAVFGEQAMKCGIDDFNDW